MANPKKHSANEGFIFNMTGDYGEGNDCGYVWVAVPKQSNIKLGYPVTAGELSYQIEVAIWQAGRGPHPDGLKKNQEMR